MLIRQVTMEDLEDIIRIENDNFSAEEAATSQALKERIEVIADTFLVAEQDGQIANQEKSGYIAVTSLSVDKAFQKQGVGTTLLAALKDLTVAQNRLGIHLTCHDYLISYYEMNGFSNEGLSESTHGGTVWYNMIWENPKI